MKKKCIGMYFLMVTTLLLATENILEFENEKIYFSVFGHVNSKYFIDGNTVYDDYKYQKTKQPNKDHYDQISLNDSICNDGIKIKIGYKYTTDGLNNNINSLIGFTGSRDPFIDFRVSIKEDNRRGDGLLFISERESTLAKINYDPLPKISQGNEYNILQSILLDYMIEKRNKLRLFYFRNTRVGSLDSNQLRNEIVNKFELNFYELEKDLFFVEGTPLGNNDYNFIATIEPVENDVVVLYTTLFYSAFKAFNHTYIYCNVHGITGAGQSYTIFDVTKGKFDQIFSDWSYTN